MTPEASAPARTLVGVLVYGGAEFVPECLDSAARLVVPGEVDVLVLDDCSPDVEWSRTIAERCAASGIGYYRSPRNMGIPRNMNLALLRAVAERYDYVAVTNSDVIFPSNLVPAMVATAQSDPAIASVTAWSNEASSFSIENVDPSGTFVSTESVDRVSTLFERHFRGRAVDLPVGVGFCMLMPVPMVDTVGLFDPIFGRGYCEEVDWCLRAHALGYRNVLAPSAFVYHIGNATTKMVGVLEHWQTSDPANDAIVNLRYPDYQATLHAWGRAPTLDDLRAEAERELVVEAAREHGYSVEVAATPFHERSDEAHFVVSPDPGARTLRATHRGFEAVVALDGTPVLGQLEGLTGRRPTRIVIRERGGRSEEVADAASALGLPVVDEYSYPQPAVPRGAAERPRPR